MYLFIISEVSQSTVPNGVFGEGRVIGQLNDRELDESSGLATSRRHKDVLYTLNDHGGKAR